MRFRKLRIAFSITCLIACVLLTALWLKSNWCADCVERVNGGVNTTIAAAWGVVVVSRTDWNAVGMPAEIRDSINRNENWKHSNRYPEFDYRHRFAFSRKGRFQLQIQTPIWFPVLLFATLAVVPWITSLRYLKWKFSLRTLMIATTLVAMVLGAIATISR